MKRELDTTERHFATTRQEAEALVEQAKNEEKSNLTSQKIDQKANKYGEYFVVTLKFTYNTPKELMAYE